MLIMSVIIYLYYCYCLWTMARKRAFRWAWAAWVPLLNLYLLCRLAGWGVVLGLVFTALLIAPTVLWFHYGLKTSGFAYLMKRTLPLVLLLVALVVAVKLSVHMRRGWWFGILLVIPVVNYFAFWLMAFSVPRKYRFATAEPQAA